MLKFFRKYNKTLLAVVAALMMIVFIGGGALEAMLQPKVGNVPIGMAFSSEITQAQQSFINTQTEILTRLGFQWNRPWGFDFRLEPLKSLDYLLLTMEAERLGLRPDIDRSREFLRLRAPQNLTRMRLQLRVSEENVEYAVANMLMVSDAWNMAASSVHVSDLDLNRAVMRTYEKLGASIVSLDARTFVDDSEQFSDAELQAHFDQYKEQLRGNSPMAFGYMIPDQVKVDYIRIASSEINPRRQVTRKMAETYWQEHKTDFPKPAADDTAEGEPVEENASPYFESFDEVQEEVYAALRRNQQLQSGRQMAEILRQRLSDAWFAQETGDDGYPVAPEGVDSADYYSTLTQGLVAGLEAPQAVHYGTTALFSPADAVQQPEIGTSRQDVVGRGIGQAFGVGITRVQGLEQRSKDNPAEVGGPLAKYQTASRVMLDDDNNLYLYRVVEVAEARPPSGLADVRDQVVEDLRLQRALDRAMEHAEALKQNVDESTPLLAAWEAFPELDDAVKEQTGRAFEAAPFARTTGTASPVVVRDTAANEENTIFSDKFVSEVYSIFDSQGSGGLGVIEVEEMQRAFVVQLGDIRHLTPEDFDQNKQRVEFRLRQDRLERLKQEWFRPEKIRARCEYAPPAA